MLQYTEKCFASSTNSENGCYKLPVMKSLIDDRLWYSHICAEKGR